MAAIFGVLRLDRALEFWIAVQPLLDAVEIVNC